MFYHNKKIAFCLMFLIDVQILHCCEKKKDHEAAAQSQGQTKIAPKESIMMSIMQCPQLSKIPYGPWRNFVAPACASIDPVLPLMVRPHVQLIHVRPITEYGHGVCSAHFNSDGTQVVSVAYNKLFCWTLAQKDIQIKETGHLYLNVARTNKAGNALLVGHNNGVSIYDMQTGECLKHNHELQNVHIADFDHNERQVVVAGQNREGDVLSIWDVENNCQTVLDKSTLSGRLITSASFNDKVGKIVSSITDRDLELYLVQEGHKPGATIKIWDTETRNLLHAINLEGEQVLATCFNHDGSKILGSVSNEDGQCFGRLWNTQTGKQIAQFKERCKKNQDEQDDYLVAHFNHDGTQIVSGTNSGFAYIRDAHSFQKLVRLAGPTHCASSVEFNHDDTQVLMTRNDKKNVHIWNVPILKDLHRTTQPQAHLISLLARCKDILKADPKKRKPTEFYLASIPKAKKFDQAQTQEFMAEARATLNSFDPLVKAAIIKKFKIKDAESKKAKE